MDLLIELQAIPGPSGDEGLIADRVEACCRAVPGATVQRIGEMVCAVRGKPRVAVLAHMDTVGFTLAHDRHLFPIGGPAPEGDEALREVGGTGTARLRLKVKDGKTTWKLSGKQGEPGSRWVYADPLRIRKGVVKGPYLDNRAGVWNGVRTLERCPDVAVLFTVGEEHGLRGGYVAARLLWEEFGIRRALISDITWDTVYIHIGQGPAISLRDRMMPRQRFLQRVLEVAEASGLPFQREIERDGGSDGHALERSGYPIDWVFVGAPQKRSHTPREECVISDLHQMTDLYQALVEGLSRDES